MDNLVFVCYSGLYVRYSDIMSISEMLPKTQESMLEVLGNDDIIDTPTMMYITTDGGMDCIELENPFNKNTLGFTESYYSSGPDMFKSFFVRGYYKFWDSQNEKEKKG